ncbi:hypothetical protein GCM10023149_09760 [Mucilaginibacter gynuensis]|uniref:Uncharacterized protein n=1 Tax=Mucilaginibacter gynuensis TaxID=1302236 RepID=A0ABP8FYZ7_9SPHI
MNRLFTLICHFYKPIAFINILFTGLSIYAFIKNGVEHLSIPSILKLFSYTVVVGYQYFFSAKSYFYFRNAGYSVRSLYVRVFVLDFAAFLVLIIGTYFILWKH